MNDREREQLATDKSKVLTLNDDPDIILSFGPLTSRYYSGRPTQQELVAQFHFVQVGSRWHRYFHHTNADEEIALTITAAIERAGFRHYRFRSAKPRPRKHRAEDGQKVTLSEADIIRRAKAALARASGR